MNPSIEYNCKGEEVPQQSRQDLQLERSEIVKWKIMPFPTTLRKTQISLPQVGKCQRSSQMKNFNYNKNKEK